MPSKWYKYGLLLAGLGVLTVYGIWDPAHHAFFPPCPFRTATGWRCPGCGSQRALHALLNGAWTRAWHLHPLLLLSLPYLLLGALADRVKPAPYWLLRWRRRLYGRQAIYVVLAVVLLYTVLRNLYPAPLA